MHKMKKILKFFVYTNIYNSYALLNQDKSIKGQKMS